MRILLCSRYMVFDYHLDLTSYKMWAFNNKFTVDLQSVSPFVLPFLGFVFPKFSLLVAGLGYFRLQIRILRKKSRLQPAGNVRRPTAKSKSEKK